MLASEWKLMKASKHTSKIAVTFKYEGADPIIQGVWDTLNKRERNAAYSAFSPTMQNSKGSPPGEDISSCFQRHYAFKRESRKSHLQRLEMYSG